MIEKIEFDFDLIWLVHFRTYKVYPIFPNMYSTTFVLGMVG